MVRNYPSAWDKDVSFVHHIPSAEYLKRYCHTVGECGLAIAGSIPCYSALYSVMLGASPYALSKELLEGTGFLMMSKGLTPEERVVSSQSRFSFYLAFGVLPDMQVAVEREVREKDLTQLTEAVLSGPSILSN
jgi:hypothetical protein